MKTLNSYLNGGGRTLNKLAPSFCERPAQRASAAVRVMGVSEVVLGFIGAYIITRAVSNPMGWPLFVLPAAIAAIAYLYMIPSPFVAMMERIEPRIVWRRAWRPGRPRIALTIDDVPYLGHKSGPRRDGASRLAEILDVLRLHGARATFFVMSHEDGERWHGDTVRRAVAEGHELGNHGTVDEAMASLPAEACAAKIAHCDRYLTRLGNETTATAAAVDGARRAATTANAIKWFRPGGGRWNEPMLRAAAALGYRTVLGTVYSLVEPWSSAKAPWLTRCTARFLRARARAGAVAIVHDRACTPEVLRRALPDLTARFEVVTLSELFGGEP